MANSFSTAAGKIITGMASLITAGTLLKADRGLLDLEKEINFPAFGICLARLTRDKTSKIWEAQYLLQMVVAPTAVSEDTLIEVLKAVTAAIDTVADGGSAGAVIDSPVWEPAPRHTGSAGWVMNVAVGSLRMRAGDPL